MFQCYLDKRLIWASADLHSGLAQVDPPRQLLSHESVRVVGPLKHPLQSSELSRRERGSVATRLLPLPVVTVQNAVLLCKEKGASEKLTFPVKTFPRFAQSDAALPCLRKHVTSPDLS